MRRPRKTMKKLIEEARTKFISRASRMVDTYFQATEGALKDGQFDVASKSAQWYIQNVSSEGARIIDRPETGKTGGTVQIGIKVGGIDQPVTAIAVPTSASDPIDEA